MFSDRLRMCCWINENQVARNDGLCACGLARFYFCVFVSAIAGRAPDSRNRLLGPPSRNLLVVPVAFKFFTKSCCGPRGVKILFFDFFLVLQKVLVAPAPLRICSFQKSMKIVDVCKTKGKAMILQDLGLDLEGRRLRSLSCRLRVFVSSCSV